MKKKYLWIGLIVVVMLAVVGSAVALANGTNDVKAWVKNTGGDIGKVILSSVDGATYQVDNPEPSHPERWTLEAWNIQGEKGDKGDKGDPGEQGIQGPKGEQGIQGERGLKGDDGAQGLQGDVGPAGSQGEPGIQGPPGNDGPQGLKGDKGDTGATGPKGDKGDQGGPGVVGPQGPQGPAGLVNYRAGTATIVAKAKSVTVSFSSTLPNANYSVALTNTSSLNYWWNSLKVSNKTATGFTITALYTMSSSIVFDWIAILYN